MRLVEAIACSIAAMSFQPLVERMISAPGATGVPGRVPLLRLCQDTTRCETRETIIDDHRESVDHLALFKDFRVFDVEIC